MTSKTEFVKKPNDDDDDDNGYFEGVHEWECCVACGAYLTPQDGERLCRYCDSL